MSAVLGGLAGAMIARSGDKKNNAGAILITMLKAEAVKIFVIALLLFLTFKLYNEHLVPIALILGLAASAILSGAAFFGLDKK
jgi:ATP synthase protein I